MFNVKNFIYLKQGYFKHSIPVPEKFNFKHPNLKILDWVNHKKILQYYNKSSISVVPSKWQAPFGRTAMESAAAGCATITSTKGGLPETFDNN